MVDTRTSEKLITELDRFGEQMMLESLQPVLLCSGSLRRHLRKLLERVLPHISVISMNEIPWTINIASYGIIAIERSIIERDRVAESRNLPEPASAESNTNLQGAN